jgi:hypothetical protein
MGIEPVSDAWEASVAGSQKARSHSVNAGAIRVPFYSLMRPAFLHAPVSP